MIRSTLNRGVRSGTSAAVAAAPLTVAARFAARFAMRFTRAPLLVALFAAGIGSGCTPSRTPAPESPAPTRPAPGTPPTQPAEARPGRADFVYAPGTYRYQVASEASVELLRDSTTPRPGSLVDTLMTKIHITYQIGGDGAARRLTGSVDSFTVQSTGLVPTGQRALAAPLPFAATLSDGRRPATFEAHPDTACAAPDAALLAVARDLLVPAPTSLTPGSVWSDTVASTVCRAGIPVTARSVRSYRVVGPAVRDSVPAIQLTRETALTMTGGGTPRGDTVTVTGTGRGSGELFVDPATGHYLGGDEETTVELTVSNGTQTRRFVQRSRQETRLVRPGSD
jgi:hypothetical protein